MASKRKEFKKLHFHNFAITIRVLSLEERYVTSFELTWNASSQGCFLAIISPFRGVLGFIWTNLNSLHPRILCAEFGSNWPNSAWAQWCLRRWNCGKFTTAITPYIRDSVTMDKFFIKKLTSIYGLSKHQRIAQEPLNRAS